MIKRIFLVILIITAPNFQLLCQKDYYMKNNQGTYGIKLVDGGAFANSKQCEIKNGEKSIIYGPDIVSEYGFGDGRVYISKTIKVNDTARMVFLERLIKGKINLYFYKGENGKKYFLEKDSSNFIELVKKSISNEKLSFKEVLQSYTKDCDNFSDFVEQIHFNKYSLSRLVEKYNFHNFKPFPVLKYGAILELGQTTLVKTNNSSDNPLMIAHFNNDYYISFGLFLDIPLLLSDFSFHPEVYYIKNGFTSHKKTNSSVVDYIINTSSINVPLLFRYTFPNSKYKPFLNIGLLYAYNYRNDNLVYQTVKMDNIYEIYLPSKQLLVSQNQFGYSLGSGFELKVNSMNSINIEFRYSSLYSISGGSFKNNRIQLLMGINL
jgi:hypothetical protein